MTVILSMVDATHTAKPQIVFRRRVFLCAAVAVAIVLNLAWFGVFTFVNGFLVHELHQSNAEWSQATLWFLAGMLLAQLLCTEIAARIGRRHTVAFALLAASIGYCALSALHDIRLIHLVMAVMGFVPAILLVVWISLAVEQGGAKPGKTIAYIMFINSIAGAVVLAAGSRLATAGTYRTAFVVFAIVCTVCAAVYHMATRGLAEPAALKVTSIFRLKWSETGKVLTRPLIVVILAGYCAEAFLSLTVNQLYPNLSRDAGSLSENMIGNIVAAGRLPALLSLFIMSRVIDRLNPYMCYGLGIGSAAASIVWLAAAPDSSALVTGYLLFYLVYGVIWSTNMTSLNASVDSPYRDIAFAVGGMAAVIAFVLSGIVHRLLLGAGVSLQHAFFICGLVGAIGGTALCVYSIVARKEISSRHS